MIASTTLSPVLSGGSTLGAFLRQRRAGLDPHAFGFPGGRRRTPGLRREEVAQRANISAAWYMCLEQGRGGAPSAEVLESLSRALLLTDTEREHLFVLGLGRTPEVSYRHLDGIEPRLQRLLDVFTAAPALIKTATWDVVAWNRAATLFWPAFERLVPRERNSLRMVFLDPGSRHLYKNWAAVARMSVAMFRADVARAGAMAEVAPLIEELAENSPAFRKLWRQNAVASNHHALKTLCHPDLGAVNFDSSTLGIDGRQDLAMLVFLPVAAADAKRLSELLR